MANTERLQRLYADCFRPLAGINCNEEKEEMDMENI